MYAYDYGTVVMYAWNKAIDEDTTYKDFYIGDGMIIYIDDLSDRYSSTVVDEIESKDEHINTEQLLDEWVKEFQRYGAHKLTIKDSICAAYDKQIVKDEIGREVPVLAELNCLKDNLLIQIRAYIPESELVKVLENML